MSEQPKQFDRAAALANRLHLLETDFADQAPEVRRGYLSEEVRRVLATVAAGDQPAFLSDLKARFPAWLSKVDLNSPPPAPGSSPDQKTLNDPAALVARLIELYKSLPEPGRREVSDHLTSARLVSASSPNWPPQALAELCAKLQLGANDKLDPGRGLELVAQLTEFACSLDQVAWRTWRALAPNSVHRRSTPLVATLGRFATGDAAVGHEQLVNELKLLRQLTGALIGTLSQTGRIALQHFRSLAPEEIKLLVGPKGFSREAAYWRKYEELVGSMDVPSMEEAIRSALVAFAEPLIQVPK